MLALSTPCGRATDDNQRVNHRDVAGPADGSPFAHRVRPPAALTFSRVGMIRNILIVARGVDVPFTSELSSARLRCRQRRSALLVLEKLQDRRLGERMNRRRLALAVGVFVLLAPVLSACTGPPEPGPRSPSATSSSVDSSTSSTPVPQSIKPPAATGTTLGTWVSLPNTARGGPIDAHGEGLWVALNCAGSGAVTVDIGDVTSSTFQCTSDDTMAYANHFNQAHGQATVSVSATGDVMWGLTISSTPVTNSTQG